MDGYWVKEAWLILRAAYNLNNISGPYGFYELCEDLEIEVKRELLIGYYGLLKDNASHIEIVLHRDLCENCSISTGYHELAHYFLIFKAHVPRSRFLNREDYRLVEELCDAFAHARTGIANLCDECKPIIKK